MAVIRDIIPAFELFQPATIDDAVRLVDKYRDDYWVLAGGLDSMDWLKDRLRRPRYVIDLSQIKELVGLEIGAMTPLTAVATSPLVRDRFGLLAEAAGLVATPQIRNQGTIGGNVSQDTRCWYYRGGWTCYRAGGNICYADTPTAINREHALLFLGEVSAWAERCVAVSPSDTAPALVALDAQMVIRSARGERVVNAEDYFVGPAIDITRMTVLRPGEVLTSIRIPATWAGAQFYFEKVRDRQAWDFPLVNVASALTGTNQRIEAARLVVGAVSATPKRLANVEQAIVGKPRDEQTA